MPIVNGKYVPPTGGWRNNTTPAINAVELNAISDTLSKIPIANGGTNASTAAEARNNLGLGNTTGPVPIANGGTGASTAAAARSNFGLGNTTGPVPLNCGGTGMSTNQTASYISSGDEVLLTKWGKVVFFRFRRLMKEDEAELEGAIDEEFCPKINCFFVGQYTASESLSPSAVIKGFCAVSVSTAGTIHVTPFGAVNGFVRCTGMWLTN